MIYADGRRNDRGPTLAALAAIAALLIAPGCGPAGDGPRVSGRPDVPVEEPGPRHDGRVPRHGDAMNSSPNAAPLSLMTPDALPSALSWWGPSDLSAPPARVADFGPATDYGTEFGRRLAGGALDDSTLNAGDVSIAIRFQRTFAGNGTLINSGGFGLVFRQTNHPPGGTVLAVQIGQGSGSIGVAVAAPAASDTAFHTAHFVAERASGVLKLYLDGVLPTQYVFYDFGSTTNAIGTGPWNISSSLCFGGNSSNSRQFFGGLGQATIWSRGLSATEVAAYHNGGRSLTRDGLAASGLDSGLLRDWPLDEPATAVAPATRAESSGNADWALAAVNIAGGSTYPASTAVAPRTQLSWTDAVGDRDLAKSGTSRTPAMTRSPGPRVSFSGTDRLGADGAVLCGLDRWTATFCVATPTAPPGSEACLAEEHSASGATLRFSIAPSTGYPRVSYRPAGGSLVTVDGDVNLCDGKSYDPDRRFVLIVRRDGSDVTFRVRAAAAGGGTLPVAAASGGESTTLGYSEAMEGRRWTAPCSTWRSSATPWTT